jgi:hypothetical protein
MGSPSGMAATARAIAILYIKYNGLPVNTPTNPLRSHHDFLPMGGQASYGYRQGSYI